MQVKALETALRTLNEKVAAAKKRYDIRCNKIEVTKKANNATVIEIERLRVLGSALTGGMCALILFCFCLVISLPTIR